MNNLSFEDFCSISKISEQKLKIDIVILFLWFHKRVLEKDNITISQINNYFRQSHLPEYNSTFLKRDLTKDKRITKGDKKESYKLNRNTLNNLDLKFQHLITGESETKVRVNLLNTPFIDDLDFEGAQKMSQLYIILHCWENSVRKFIENTLKTDLGDDWWEEVKSADLERKYNDRKLKEQKSKWISPRGESSPLYYLDWGDLVKIIRKREESFISKIPDIKFVELRLEELERLRNIIAHNGIYPEENDIDRIIVHFKDWCNQFST